MLRSPQSFDIRSDIVRAKNVTWVTQLGFNPNVSTADFEEVWYGSAPYVFLQVAQRLRVRAGGNAADTALGAGARAVTIFGVNAVGTPIEETIPTAGASASTATTQAFLRVHRVVVATVGTFAGANVGDVLIETITGTLQAAIQAGAAQAYPGMFSVPANHVAYLFDVHLMLESTKTVTFLLSTLEDYTASGPPFPARRVNEVYTGVGQPVDFEYATPRRFPPLTDIAFLAKAGGTNSAVSVTMTFAVITL